MAGMTLDALDFRNALARFASGVTVVTAKDAGGRPAGFTASAFSSLSLDPPLVLVCLEKRAQSYEVFAATEHVAVSILAAGQGDIAWQFARKEIDKFEGVSLETGEVTGLPLIQGATAHLEGRVYERLDGGDHTIFIVEVLRAHTEDLPPLLHFNRQMGRFVAD
ncbi:MAG: flavin reductase family protein [Chloroflexi bacterium]|nr:flavin reductase family protein [Chloroflexota bacterium]